jgi:putative peptidoglycan lipid II flippase
VCVVSGWLLAVVADVLLAAALPARDRALALGAGHSIGVTVAGLGLLVVVARVVGPAALAGVLRVGGPALAGAVLGAAAGLAVGRVLGADPLPSGGVLAAIGTGIAVAAVVAVVAVAVIMGSARGPLMTAVRGVRTSGRQEVHGG